MRYITKKMLSKDGNAVMQGITFFFQHTRLMLAFGWGLKPGEWWYSKDPSTAKFLWWSKKKLEDKSTQLGFYFGRLGLCLMYGPK